MDIDTTSINELPVVNTPVPTQDDQMAQQNISSNSHVVDEQSIAVLDDNKKHVRFSDESLETFENTILQNTSNNYQETKYDVTLQFKIIILATILFFFFMDGKIKKYILNILVQIFGSFLKTEHGNMSQIGLLFYSLFFGCVMLLIVKSIDISSFHLAI